MSPHLFVLHVPHEPLFDEPGSLFQNLHFLASAEEIVDPHMVWRGRRAWVLKEVMWGLPEVSVLVGFQCFLAPKGMESWGK